MTPCILDDYENIAIREALEEAIGEKENSIAGTALIGMESLSQEYSEFSRKDVAGKALAMVNDKNCGLEGRITAMAICGQMEIKEVLPLARVVAQTGEVIPLRMAAIGAIGNVGAVEDVDLLNGFRAGSDKTLSKTAEAALKRIRQRTNP